jgi:lysine biosynthesis protein LysW
VNQLKRSEFKKKLFFVQKCQSCYEEIKLQALPELNKIIKCELCGSEYEISSVYNYIKNINKASSEAKESS